MVIKELSLTNYRNYSDVSLQFTGGLNLIIGRNAVGKTNLLEAIHFLETGRSHRTNSNQELIKWECDFALIKAAILRKDRDIEVEAILQKTGGKKLKVNGVVQKGFQGRVRPVHTVLFTPDHLKIVKEMPEHRRAYIDEVLEKVKPDYGYWRSHYSKILRQRNMLLKKVFVGRMKSDVIDYWDSQLVEAGVKLVAGRKAVIERLERHATEAYRTISGCESAFSLTYENQLLAEDTTTIDILKERFLQLLKEKRSTDIERGQTLTGPHRDDMGIFVGGIDLRTFGSQGEQRSASLALKLAELAIVSASINDQPVLLLDDVMSELDEVRRAALLEHARDGLQTMITSTNMDYFTAGDIAGANVLTIEC